MIPDVASLIEKYAITGILVDSNLLLLLFVGAHDRSLIASFKRTHDFTPEDYDLLRALLDRFRAIYTTPNILTEVSNLAGYVKEPAKEVLFDSLRLQIADMSEEYILSAVAAEDELFPRYGLTDTVIFELAAARHLLVLTDDFRLAGFLRTKKVDTINFNNIRTYLWQ